MKTTQVNRMFGEAKFPSRLSLELEVSVIIPVPAKLDMRFLFLFCQFFGKMPLKFPLIGNDIN